MNFQTNQDETQSNEVEEAGDVSPDSDASGGGEKKPQVSRETLGLMGCSWPAAGCWRSCTCATARSRPGRRLQAAGMPRSSTSSSGTATST